MMETIPKYQYEFYDDQRIEKFIQEYYPGEIVQTYRQIHIGAAKADFFRYLALYAFGGIYVDIDSYIAKNLDEIIREDDSAIITKERNPGLFVQWALIYEKGHPFLKKTIDLIIENIAENKYPHDVHRTTGPTVYSQAVHYFIDNEERKASVNYRCYGYDYEGYIMFKMPKWKTFSLYHGKKPWRREQKKYDI